MHKQLTLGKVHELLGEKAGYNIVVKYYPNYANTSNKDNVCLWAVETVDDLSFLHWALCALFFF